MNIHSKFLLIQQMVASLKLLLSLPNHLVVQRQLITITMVVAVLQHRLQQVAKIKRLSFLMLRVLDIPLTVGLMQKVVEIVQVEQVKNIIQLLLLLPYTHNGQKTVIHWHTAVITTQLQKTKHPSNQAKRHLHYTIHVQAIMDYLLQSLLLVVVSCGLLALITHGRLLLINRVQL